MIRSLNCRTATLAFPTVREFSFTVVRQLFLWLGFVLASPFATCCLLARTGLAETITTKGGELEKTVWAQQPMLMDPVALSFHDNGTLYLVETSRRSTVDIDIRAHKSWILEDLNNQSIDDLRAFFRAKMSPQLSLENQQWLEDRNQDGTHDWRDLMTMKETVRLLRDSDDDGAADVSKVFADGFNEEVNGVIAGVLPVDDDVLTTIYPDLWRLTDTDNDGVADERKIDFRGFGVHAAFDGHDLHGLTIGPDGKIYFSVGDNGFSIRTREGKLLHRPIRVACCEWTAMDRTWKSFRMALATFKRLLSMSMETCFRLTMMVTFKTSVNGLSILSKVAIQGGD